MSDRAIYIAFQLADEPKGGGNQFLRALAKSLEKKNRLAKHSDDADVVLFNSYQYPELVLDAYARNKRAMFIHRIDGPMKLYNSPSDRRDNLTYFLNKKFADATIFQTQWSMQENIRLGLSKKPNTIIRNGVDKSIFYCKSPEAPAEKPIRIISNSWSANIKKGFDTYRFLDDSLDFKKYKYTFIGNSPYRFKNIDIIPPVGSKELAGYLRDNDIYLTASQSDPCSNSLLEAQACGLRSIALRDGGHPEIIVDKSLLFIGKQDILNCIERAEKSLGKGVELSSAVDSIDQACANYLNFIDSIFEVKGFRAPSFVKQSQLRGFLLYNNVVGKLSVV